MSEETEHSGETTQQVLEAPDDTEPPIASETTFPPVEAVENPVTSTPLDNSIEDHQHTGHNQIKWYRTSTYCPYC